MNRDAFINRTLRLPGSLRMRARIWMWRTMGARIGPGCWIRDIQLPVSPWNIEIGEGVMLQPNVALVTAEARLAQPGISLGKCVYIGRFTVLEAEGRIEIGDYTLIGPHCFLTDHDHKTEPGILIREQDLIIAPLIIGSNVWIGAGALILKGVTIGDDAVIGAGAVVTRDVAPGARVVGVPARALAARNVAPETR